MKAAAARSLSRQRKVAGFISHLRDRVHSFSKVLIAELLCATSCEVA